MDCLGLHCRDSGKAHYRIIVCLCKRRHLDRELESIVKTYSRRMKSDSSTRDLADFDEHSLMHEFLATLSVNMLDSF